METIVNAEEKIVVCIDPTLEELANFLHNTEEELGDFKIILEWSENL